MAQGQLGLGHGPGTAGRAPGQPGRGQLGEHLVNLREHLVNLGQLREHLVEHLVEHLGQLREHLVEHLVNLARYSWPLHLVNHPRPAARFTGQLRQLARANGTRHKKTGQGPVKTGQLARLIWQVNLYLGQGSCEFVLACRNRIGQVISVVTGQDSWPIWPGRIRAPDDCAVVATIPVMTYPERVAPMRANVNGPGHLTLRMLRLAWAGPGPTIDVITQ